MVDWRTPLSTGSVTWVTPALRQISHLIRGAPPLLNTQSQDISQALIAHSALESELCPGLTNSAENLDIFPIATSSSKNMADSLILIAWEKACAQTRFSWGETHLRGL